MIPTAFARLFALAITVFAIPGFFAAALASSSDDHKHGYKTGRPGEAAEATRTVEVVMYDNYYEPKTISVGKGETVRFLVRNAGEFVHEFNIGTAKMHADHQQEMMKMMESGMLEADRINGATGIAMHGSKGHGMHDDSNSVLLEPGQTGELVWRFEGGVELEYACNVPGHYEAGMMGHVGKRHHWGAR